MILPDINLLLYAYDEQEPLHLRARAYWEAALEGSEPVALASVTVAGFVRLSMSERRYRIPLSAHDALRRVEAWLAQPAVVMIEPGDGHFAIFARLLRQGRTGHGSVTDAHLAALAIQHGATLHSHDGGFRHWPELKLLDPLA